MNIERTNLDLKYIYHYTLKENVKKILNEKAIKSKDQYVFFTKSLNDSVIAFNNEMMRQNKFYIDVEGVLRKREKCNKNDYCILKIPYTNDNEFYKFTFENQQNDSIYSLSIAHKGKYSFKNAKVLDFPDRKQNNNLKVLSKTAAVTIAAGIMLFSHNVYAASWLDSGNFNTGWYTLAESSPDYNITSAQELAGLSHLVNNQSKTFATKTIWIREDIDLTDNNWVTLNDIFQGNICGSHRILLNFSDGEFANSRSFDQVVYKLKITENNKISKNIVVTKPYTVEKLKNITGSRSVFFNNQELSNDTSLLELNLKDNDVLEVFTSNFLYIQNYKGVKKPFYFESGDSVDNLTELYSEKANIKNSRIFFKFNNKELARNTTLADYNIQKFSTLNAFVKVKINTDVNKGKGSINTSKTTAFSGDTVTVTLTPDSNYKLLKLTVNGIDKTSEVKNNKLNIECGEQDINIKADYKLKNQKSANSPSKPKNEENLLKSPKTGNNLIVFFATIITFVSGTALYKFKKALKRVN